MLHIIWLNATHQQLNIESKQPLRRMVFYSHHPGTTSLLMSTDEVRHLQNNNKKVLKSLKIYSQLPSEIVLIFMKNDCCWHLQSHSTDLSLVEKGASFMRFSIQICPHPTLRAIYSYLHKSKANEAYQKWWLLFVTLSQTKSGFQDETEFSLALSQPKALSGCLHRAVTLRMIYINCSLGSNA